MGVGTIESVRFLDFTNAAGGGQALTVLELLSHQHNGLGQVQSGLVIIGMLRGLGWFWSVVTIFLMLFCLPMSFHYF